MLFVIVTFSDKILSFFTCFLFNEMVVVGGEKQGTIAAFMS